LNVLKDIYSYSIYKKVNFNEINETWEYFHSVFEGIVFVPKDSTNVTKNYYDPTWEVSDINTLLNKFHLYRQVPSAITNHRKHGKYYENKNIFKRLQLVEHIK